MTISIFKKRTRSQLPEETGKENMENKPRKKSIFRSRKSSVPSIQPADTWSLSESSSFDTLEPSDSIALPLEAANSLVLPIVLPTTTESKNKDFTETEVDVPAGFEHLVETTAPDGNGFLFMQRAVSYTHLRAHET